VTKLSRTEKMLYQLRPYYFELNRLLEDLLGNIKGVTHPAFEKRSTSGKICLCLFTSDGGLCGVYNTTIIRAAEEFIKEKGKDKVRLITVGKRGFNYFKKRQVEVINSYIGAHGKYSDKLSKAIVAELIELFLKKEVDAIYIAYMRFGSTIIHKPIIEKFLNLETREVSGSGYIFEPDAKKIIDVLIPKYLFMKMKLILLESFTSEHAARTVAMKMASDNAGELLTSLTLLRNKVRQAIITQDIMEVISSSEALKG